MPVERRLRSGLTRNADAVDPDVDRFLSTVQRRARRRVITRRGAAGLAVAAAVAAVVISARERCIRLAESRRLAPPAVHPSPRPASEALSGRFTRTVAPGGSAIQSAHMAGRWTIRLSGGTINPVAAPTTFTGLISTFQYQVRGSEFRTNLFIGDVCLNLAAGTYHWALSGRTLRFVAVSDRCPARVALLTSGPWQKRP